jgi:hypothetical protein
MPQLLSLDGTPGAAAQRRRIRYVDKFLQRRLLAALVVVEIALVAGAIWLMHGRLSALINDNLYRAHLANTGPLTGQLLNEALPLIVAFVVINLVALLIVDGIWHRHFKALLQDFTGLMDKTKALDFSPDPGAMAPHEVVALTLKHRERERIRLASLRVQVNALAAELPPLAENRSPQRTQDALLELQKLLRV